MNPLIRPALLVIAVASSTGCATFESANNVSKGSPRFFAGSRLDIAALAHDWDQLDRFHDYGMKAPDYPGADLPFSLAADVVIFPAALGYTIFVEPVVAIGR